MRPILFFLGTLAFAQDYDLILRGGRVIDPKNNLDAVRDVAVKSSKIAAIAPSITAPARRTVDVKGLLVTPGLIDIHAHVFVGTTHNTTAGGDRAIPPDQIGPRTGVTTLVDAGSSGWRMFPDFRRTIIDHAQTRVLAFLNIAGIGILAYELEQNPEDMDPQLTADMIRKNRDVLVGVKSAHWHPANFISVERAVQAGKLANVPVMVDFGYFLPDRPYETMITDKLRPGDISTHFYRWPAPLLDANGKVRSYLHDARRRGVKFDAGHGGGSFHFRLAEPMMQQGFWPDSISTDIHLNSMNGSMIDMLNVMSKFMAMGLPLDETIRRSTINPALEIQHPELGHLTIGAEADIAVLRLDKGNYGFADCAGGTIKGSERLACEMTVRAGKIVFDLNSRAGAPWRTAPLRYPEK
ncbi:MAG TPA: amidohydrolase/deacetylase family metallohydrolase [Bryobacteraceae bacterium]|nr:amidohydrolase/deacetylase family metallohydrolase [Bryobacteraceae bacterium]